MEGAEPAERRGGIEGHGFEQADPFLLHHDHHGHHHRNGGGGGGESARPLTGLAPSGEAPPLRLEEHHFDWGYSRPVVALDLAWNLAFVLVSASVLLTTARERPSTPIRAWIFGYAVQCLLHVGFLYFEYRRRRRSRVWRRSRWAGEEDEEMEGSPESRY